MWTLCITVQIKLRYQCPPAYCERGLKQTDYEHSYERKPDDKKFGVACFELLSPYEVPLRNAFAFKVEFIRFLFQTLGTLRTYISLQQVK